MTSDRNVTANRRCGSVIAVILLLSLCLTARSDAKPLVKSVEPLGVRAGRTTTLSIYGDNLAPVSLSIAKTSFTAKLIGFKPTNDKSKGKGASVVSVELTVPAGAPSENVDIQLVQPDKTKVPASAAIVDDVAEEVQVKKPCSSFATSMPIASKSIAISGTLDGDTADLFKLEAHRDEIWDLSLLCGRGGSLLDPILRVRNSRHITLLLSAGDKKRDRHLVFRAPSDGYYYIDITEAEAKGGAGYDYRLTVRQTQ